MRGHFATFIQISIFEGLEKAFGFITKPNVWIASPYSGFSIPVGCINCCVVVHIVVVPTTTAIIKPFPSMRSALRR